MKNLLRAFLVSTFLLVGFTVPDGIPPVPSEAIYEGPDTANCSNGITIGIAYYVLGGELETPARAIYWFLYKTDEVFALSLVKNEELNYVFLAYPDGSVKHVFGEDLADIEHPCDTAKRIVKAKKLQKI